MLLVAVAFFRAPLSSLFWRIATPVLNARSVPARGFSALLAQFSSKVVLMEENRRLAAALASSSILVLDRNTLALENQSLKARLGRNTNTRSVFGAVVLAPPGVPYDTLFVDVGSSEGVSVGDLVFAGGSVVVGRIAQVYPHAARVVLLSSPGESNDAVVETAGGAVPLTVSGQGGGSLSGDVPAGTEAAVGDIVRFSGITPTFVAEVRHIEQTKSGSFLTLYLTLPVNPFILHYVEVRPLSP